MGYLLADRALHPDRGRQLRDRQGLGDGRPGDSHRRCDRHHRRRALGPVREVGHHGSPGCGRRTRRRADRLGRDRRRAELTDDHLPRDPVCAAQADRAGAVRRQHGPRRRAARAGSQGSNRGSPGGCSQRARLG